MILGLHGYRQDEVFMEKRLTQLFKKKYPLVCPRGAWKIDTEEISGNSADTNISKYGWWHLPSKEHIRIEHGYEGIQESLSQLREVIDREGCPEVVVGFSQGAVMATIIAGLGWLPTTKHMVIMSGSEIQDVKWKPTVAIGIPMISVVGTRDELCSQEDSQLLAQYYEHVEWVEHPSGHVIPTDSKTRLFLQKLLEA